MNRIHDNFDDNKNADPGIKIGDVVYLPSDLKRKVPMSVVALFPDQEDYDLRVEWLNSRKQLECQLFLANALVKE